MPLPRGTALNEVVGYFAQDPAFAATEGDAILVKWIQPQIENHAAAVALNYFAYNFIKIHRTLRTSPAMAAGVTDLLWEVEDLVALWEQYECKADRAA